MFQQIIDPVGFWDPESLDHWCRQLETEIAVLGTRAWIMIIRILPITALSPPKNKNIKSTQDYSFGAISDGPI